MRVLVILALAIATVACSDGEPSSVDSESSKQIDQMVDELFEDFENRTIYRRLDREILQAIPDERLEQAVIDYIHTKLEDDGDPEYETVMAMSPALRGFFATWQLEAEVDNGGFNQFFWNSSGQWAEQAVLGCRLFGAEQHARTVARAIEVYAREKAGQDELKVQGTTEAFVQSYEHSKLGELDSQFYGTKEDLRALRIAYVRAHPDELAGD